MELVYLWVDGYGNIEREGFNFSPKYFCEFKADYILNENGHKVLKNNCELIITPRDYIKKFFGNDINITCIVGKNGSGKSTLLDGLEKIFEVLPQNGFQLQQDDNLSEDCFGFIIVLARGEDLYYISNELVSIRCSNATLVNSIEPIQFVSYKAEDQEPEEVKNKVTLDKEAIVRMISYHHDSNFELTTFMYIPEKIKIIAKPLNEVYDELIEDMNFPWTFREEQNELSIEEEDRFDRDKRNQKFAFEESAAEIFSNAEDDYHKFLIVWYVDHYDFDENKLQRKEELFKEYSNENEGFITEEEFSQLYCDRDLLINDLTPREKYIYLKEYIELFDFDFVDKNNRNYHNLSHGEKTIFGQFLNIYYRTNYKYSKDMFLLFFDEPELALHPEWQRKYIDELITLLFKLNKKFHIVLTSHSPFLLSDLPKENVLFLINGKSTDVQMETFGANIHTLLSHGFFMENGLIGEYAKVTINKIIKYLNGQHSDIIDHDKTAQQYINLIGEPILKRQLQKMLDSKRLSEVDHIKQRIKELQEELAKKEDKR